MIKSFTRYLTEAASTVYFTFGRMNPPTVGHGILLDKITKLSGSDPYKIYLSHSVDSKKNPLAYKDKVKYARKMFPKQARSIIFDSSKKLNNPFAILVSLYNEGFTNVVMVVGSDRVREFDILLSKYNGIKAKHGFYKFESIKIQSAGERDPDANDATGMSASKMRQAAVDNDFISFNNGTPSALSDADTKKLFNLLRKGMNLKEQSSFRTHIDLDPVSETREQYVKGDLFQIGDIIEIKETKQLATITKLGTNYLIVESEEGIVNTKWLHDVNSTDRKETEASRKFKEIFGSTLRARS